MSQSVVSQVFVPHTQEGAVDRCTVRGRSAFATCCCCDQTTEDEKGAVLT
jgi:hypothetical protein